MSIGLNNVSATNGIAIFSALKSYQKNFEKLASGTRLNRASDGAAEIAIANLLKSDLVSTDRGLKNVNDGISMLQTADGSLETISQNLVRMKELAVQAGNGTYSAEQKQILQQEFDQLAAQNVQIGETTKYNGIGLHRDSQSITITAEGEQVVSIETSSISLLEADLSDVEATLSTIEEAQESVTAYRASLGSNMNTLETSADLLQNKSEQLLESISRISDTDMATTITSLISGQITAEQAVSVQAHSKIVSQIAASLL